MSQHVVRVALLICDTPVPAVLAEFGDYLQIYREWLLATLATYPDRNIAENTELVLDGYDVVDKREYPPQDRLTAGDSDAYDVVMMTGSKHSAYDNSIPFIPTLVSFIRNLATSPTTQHVKVIGICFGHQIVAVALGGECIPGTAGWEIGVYGCETIGQGSYWWSGDVAGEGGEAKVYVEQMHRDHVSSPPPGFEILLRTPRYANHSMVKYHPSSSSTNPLAQILTIQGHPEYTPAIVAHMVDTRSASGVFDGPTTTEARRRLGGRDGSGAEGFGKVGWGIWRAMLQRLPLPANGSGDVVMQDVNKGTGYLEDETRYRDIDMVLDRKGPWTHEQFIGGQQAKTVLREHIKILVIGAGGLGCEILQNLALTGFTDIHVIDMDTIDISNLNRQFLFRESDVGKSKAICAAEFVMKRVPGVKVTPYHGRIQDHPHAFYMTFHIIIGGLDSISARRWINHTLVELIDEDDPDSLKPFIDGGTEGFKGQSRVIFPTQSSCYECTIDMLTPPTAFPICTIANTPRLPEHCIEWASVLEWPKVFKEKKLDTDDPDHIEWLYQKASARANNFKIEGVTWALTQGVVKNIIPAIASTNAIIAASCCNEALKLATTCAPSLNNYMMYNGTESVYTNTYKSGKRKECPVCGGQSLKMVVSKDLTLEELVDRISNSPDLQITKPSLSLDNAPLFWHAPPDIYERTKGNLDKVVGDLLEDGAALTVTDRNLPFVLSVQIQYQHV